MAKVYPDGSSYAWTPEMGEDGIIIRMSKSTAGSYDWCVQQMWLQQNFPKEQGLVKHLVLGDDVHNGLDLFYQGIDEKHLETMTRLLESGADLTDYLTSLVPNEDTIIKNRRAENEDFPFYHDDYYRNMKWLMEYENARMKMAPNSLMPLANEVRLEVRLEVDVPPYGLVPVQFVGIIDRVFEAPGGGLMLFELKTGKWRDDKMAQMRKEMSYYKFLIENAGSEYLAERNIDREVTHWGWRYSAADHWTIEKVKAVSERLLHKRVRDLITAYMKQDFPLANADFKCSYCEYVELCPKYAIQVEGGA